MRPFSSWRKPAARRRHFQERRQGTTWTQVASTAAPDWSNGVERISFSPDGK